MQIVKETMKIGDRKFVSKNVLGDIYSVIEVEIVEIDGKTIVAKWPGLFWNGECKFICLRHQLYNTIDEAQIITDNVNIRKQNDS